MPRISVLVPAYDDERYLAEALGSIVDQDWGDLEIVVSDDGSADDTYGVAQAWAARDSRIRVLRNASNLGMTENWNRALSAARGDLLFKLDADDVLEPGTLSRLVETVQTVRPPRFVACRAVECDESLRPTGPFHGEKAFIEAGFDPASDRTLPGWRWFERSFDDAQLWHSSALLCRTDDLRAAGGWDETWSCAADTDLILRLTGTRQPVTHVGFVGVRYRRRAGSVSARFEERGWKTIEATLAPLAALSGAGRWQGRLRPRLRRNWWRLWSNVLRLRADAELWSSVPEPIRGKIERAWRRIDSPPVDVRLEGWLRDRLWVVRRRLVRKRTER